MMTRKHFEAVARILREERQLQRERPQRTDDQRTTYIASELAAVFQADNPRFDRQRFIAACTGE
jgi:hypothetical protein